MPSSYAYDYEFARAQHTLGSRLATGRRPGRDPPGAARSARRKAGKVRRYPGLKEEYYLAGFAPDPGVLDEPARSRPGARRRPHAARVSLYHRHGNPLFADVLERLGNDAAVQAVVLPRTPAQRDAIRDAALPSLVIPEHAIDAQSLIALADLVVSAGGTMNREAVALGTPVWTTFAGTIGAVDEGLIADGRLAELTDADALVLAKKTVGGAGHPRDPELMLDLLLSALEG